MNKFKAGDKVRRINDNWGYCVVGETYVVKDCVDSHVFLIADEFDYHVDNFELVEDLSDVVVSVDTEQQIITAWLDKLAYVLSRDTTVSDYLDLRVTGLTLDSDIVNIVGSSDIYQYVENTYDQLKSQEIQKKSQKLLEQKEQLAKQLADIEKELEELK